jgi:hypothetical protein
MSSATQILGIALVILAALAVVFVVAKPDLLSKTVSGFANNNGPAASMDMSNNANNGPMNAAPANNAAMNNIAMNNAAMENVALNNNGAMNNGAANNMEGFTDSGASDPSLGGPASMPFAAGNAPSNCYPKNQLNPTELLPSDPNSKWSQVNPQGAGDIAGKNYLNAGALIGVNTVGQSLRNASYDLRSEPANPQVAVSPWFNSTIEPDTNRKTFEIA